MVAEKPSIAAALTEAVGRHVTDGGLCSHCFSDFSEMTLDSCEMNS